MTDKHCNFPGELLSAYIDGEVSEQELIEVEQHLHECAACRKRLTELEQVSEFASKMAVQKPSPDFRQRLRNSIENKKQTGHGRTTWSIPWRRQLVMVAVTIIILLLPLSAVISHFQVSSRLMTEDMYQLDEAAPHDVSEPEPEADQPDAEIEDIQPFGARAESEVSQVRFEKLHFEVSDIHHIRQALSEILDEEGFELHTEALRRSDEAVEYLVEFRSPYFPDALREEIKSLGNLIYHKSERQYHPPVQLSPEVDGASNQQVDSVDIEITIRQPQHLSAEGRPRSVGDIPGFREALMGAWLNFGDDMVSVLLWVMNHLVHLLFAAVLILGGYVLYRQCA